MRNILISILLGISLLTFSSAGLAEQNTNNISKFKSAQNSPKKMFFKKLNLTSEQKSQIKQVLQSNRTQVQTLMKQLKANNKQLKSLIGAQYNPSTISTLAKQQGTIVSQLIILRMGIRNKINRILSPAQREKVKNVRQNRVRK